MSIITPRIPANYSKVIQVRAKDGSIIKDYTQLKDHEVLIKDDSVNELLTVKKTAKDNSGTVNYTITEQIKKITNELVEEGKLELGKVFGFNIDLNKFKNGQDSVSYGGTIPLQALSKVDKTEPFWTTSLLEELLGIRLVQLNWDGTIKFYYKDFNYMGTPYLDEEYTQPAPQSDYLTNQTLPFMIRFKKLWINHYMADDHTIHMRFSNKKLPESQGWKVHPAFISEQYQGQKEADYIYISPTRAQLFTNSSTGETYLTTGVNIYNESKITFPKLNEELQKLNEKSNGHPGWQSLTISQLTLIYQLWIVINKSLIVNLDNIKLMLSGGDVNHPVLSDCDYAFCKYEQSGVIGYRFLGLWNVFMQPVFLKGVCSAPTANNDSNKSRVYLANYGPYRSSLSDRLGSNYIDSGIETILDSGTGTYRTTIDAITIDPTTVFYSSQGIFIENSLYNGKFFGQVQYMPQIENIYNLFGAYSGLESTIQYKTDLISSHKTLLTFS